MAEVQMCEFHELGDCYDLKLHEVADISSPNRTVTYVCNNHMKRAIPGWTSKECSCAKCTPIVF